MQHLLWLLVQTLQRQAAEAVHQAHQEAAVTATTVHTNTPASNYGPAPSNTPAPSANVGPAAGNTNVTTKGDVTAAKRGKLNVPKTADASAMGLYAALLGLSTVAGAFVIATKKKEN